MRIGRRTPDESKNWMVPVDPINRLSKAEHDADHKGFLPPPLPLAFSTQQVFQKSPLLEASESESVDTETENPTSSITVTRKQKGKRGNKRLLKADNLPPPISNPDPATDLSGAIKTNFSEEQRSTPDKFPFKRPREAGPLQDSNKRKVSASTMNSVNLSPDPTRPAPGSPPAQGAEARYANDSRPPYTVHVQFIDDDKSRTIHPLLISKRLVPICYNEIVETR